MFATHADFAADHARLVEANQTVAALEAKWADSDAADDWALMSRDAAIWAGGSLEAFLSDNDPELFADVQRLHEAYGVLLAARSAGYDETFTGILLGYSLCPMHQGDYASCFDDDNPECAAIRAIHPGHDT